MFYRLLLSALLLILGACPVVTPKQGTIFFHYSLWRLNANNTLVDIGCVDAGIELIRIDLFFGGVNVGSAESVCDAFGNGDALNTQEELGEFLADLNSTTFDQMQISALRSDGNLLAFGLRLNDEDLLPETQQAIDFVEPITLSAEQFLTISLPGESGSQIANELQMIIP